MRKIEAGARVRLSMAAAVLLVLNACAGTVPSPRGGQGPGDRPWSPSPLPPGSVSRPVVQPIPEARSNRPPPGLEAAIHELWRTFPGRTGVAVRRIDGDWTVSRRGDEFFPQQSVSKLWVSLALLDRVDRGEVALSDRIAITPDDLTLFNQPLAARVRREGRVTESAATLIDLAITGSDNTANDSLLRHAGGPDAVRRYIDRHDLGRIRFGPGERLLQSRIAGLDWQQRYSAGSSFQVARDAVPFELRQAALQRYLADPEDGASPEAIAAALARLARGEILSPASTAYILGVMARTRSGPQRLKAGVPAGWQVAHKTGTGQVLGAVATGYNDIGILTAPDGTRYAVAVMMADTTAPIPQRMQFMQGVSRAVATYHMR